MNVTGISLLRTLERDVKRTRLSVAPLRPHSVRALVWFTIGAVFALVMMR